MANDPILDAVDVVYEIDAKFVVTAGTYSGPPTKEMLAKLLADAIAGDTWNTIFDSIEGARIIEVRVNDTPAAENL